MAVKNSRNAFLGLGLVVLFVLIVSYWWANRGYGEVSPTTYEFSKALYSACLKKSDEHLDKVGEMLDEANEDALPSNERAWLEQIIQRARKGKWESAAKSAKRMMEDQVEY